MLCTQNTFQDTPLTFNATGDDGSSAETSHSIISAADFLEEEARSSPPEASDLKEGVTFLDQLGVLLVADHILALFGRVYLMLRMRDCVRMLLWNEHVLLTDSTNPHFHTKQAQKFFAREETTRASEKLEASATTLALVKGNAKFSEKQ